MGRPGRRRDAPLSGRSCARSRSSPCCWDLPFAGPAPPPRRPPTAAPPAPPTRTGRPRLPRRQPHAAPAGLLDPGGCPRPEWSRSATDGAARRPFVARAAACMRHPLAVVVGGQPLEAMVVACPQPDGSWQFTQYTPGLPPQVYWGPAPPEAGRLCWRRVRLPRELPGLGGLAVVLWFCAGDRQRTKISPLPPTVRPSCQRCFRAAIGPRCGARLRPWRQRRRRRRDAPLDWL